MPFEPKALSEKLEIATTAGLEENTLGAAVTF